MSRKPIPPLLKHQNHQIEIQSSTAHNFAKYYCRDCKVFVSWLSKMESQKAYEQGLVKMVQN